MAQDKKSFVLYADLIHTVKKMNREDAGELLLHILKYVNDENPETDNLIVDLTFEPIKQQFKRDLKKWEITLEKRSDAGKASAEARRLAKLNQQNSTNSTHVESVQQTSTNPTVNDNVTVTVNDTVTVIPSTIVEGEKEKFDASSDLDLGIKDAFLEYQKPKEKNVAPKKESNHDFADSLKFESPTWMDSVCIQQRKPPDKIIDKIDEFILFLGSVEKEHKSRKEFIDHFVNWVTKNFKENGSKTGTGNYPPKKQAYEFSVDRVIETYSGNT